VFFDWDSAVLTARARQIVAEAAHNATRVQVTRIDVAGHADRTGTAAYNLTLSHRRADAVAAELVQHGIAKQSIDIEAFGETKPLVATADGVREPQNRRVEIVLH
jgi:outer membrane protein OmpA-like peptidoglycan-associated protein